MRGFALMPGRWQWTVARVADVMCMIASPEPQRVVPSLAECAGCVLTSADCPDRMEPSLN